MSNHVLPSYHTEPVNLAHSVAAAVPTCCSPTARQVLTQLRRAFAGSHRTEAGSSSDASEALAVMGPRLQADRKVPGAVVSSQMGRCAKWRLGHVQLAALPLCPSALQCAGDLVGMHVSQASCGVHCTLPPRATCGSAHPPTC